ncbi:hypothetical protein VB734_03740 [Synechococcus sp. BA-124 BA4]|jgi:hypothetical protein|uniref:hypothetical protein n=1 Tax=unclassified Synechococcus TaxID=2626047 RepID=UPI0018CEFF96|nr:MULTISPECIES: hypothetical protein [unclassified Synechococcus]MEA5399148.1 hypothetical protein [Synechococcus sp. BA-124 BA4]QPN56158.1 hypothetical protein I1E95_13760 [Synechococcus sp. CBW1107]CAK6699001.1 hypothetical protein BBFGKLBO_02569 [Synechococcus sp. CBW1107]
MPDFPLSSTNALALTASVLLVFVTGGVIYLSAVEWRDRRRARRPARSPSGRLSSGRR